jgi:dTDP-4-amino-4,6-dideoxygalactose transaminase
MIKQKPNQAQAVDSFQPARADDHFLVFGAPAIEDAEIQEVIATLKSGWLGTGPKTARFEADISSYKGGPHAVAVNSCTAALHLSLLASGVSQGDEVITTPLTFCATVNAIIHAGATPVLADIDPLTMNIDPDAVEAAITERTKVILPVHFAGRPCNMDRLCTIVEQNKLKMIEDCAHAIETEYRDKAAGTFGDFGCLSFYVTKNVATGEGGMVLTSNEVDAARIKMLGLHGMTKDAWRRFSDDGYKHYYVAAPGFKYNMMDIQAAIGIHQLARIDTNWVRRQTIWQRYNEALADLPIVLPASPEPGTRHGYHLYTILIDEKRAGISRDQFLDAMTRHNIGVGVHYLSIPEHPYYKDRFGWLAEDFPNAMRIGRETVSLPLSPRLLDSDVNDVIYAVRNILAAETRAE